MHDNPGWKDARERAADRYPEVIGHACPAGFRSLRAHDLKHTFGHWLRAAGVGFENRKALLGHKSDHVTKHYSAPEISNLIAATERVCELEPRKSHAGIQALAISGPWSRRRETVQILHTGQCTSTQR